MQTHVFKPVVQPGQQLNLRWREAKKDHPVVYKFLSEMLLTADNNGYPYALCYCMYFSDEGLSVYIARGYTHGGDIEGFLPSKNVRWQVYFEPLDSFEMSYARNEHCKAMFPQEFLRNG